MFPQSEGAPAGRLSFFRPAARPFVRLTGAALALACAVQLFSACNKKTDPNADPKVTAGHGQYLAHCIACHNVNPVLDGSLGPALKGSALELLQARVLRGEYPAGYSPKRQTHIMVKLPLTEEDVAALHAYLNAP